jgi:adenylosuccinate lyase
MFNNFIFALSILYKMPDFSHLLAISPIDGRYQKQTAHLQDYFSEYALIKYRVHVEIEYFIALSNAGFFKLSKASQKLLRDVHLGFSTKDAQKIKDTEKITNHDVKAVEYFLKDVLKKNKLEQHTEWIHFGLTSQDINNTAIPLLWKYALSEVFLTSLNDVISTLKTLAKSWKNIPLLARTHGQAASPTNLGKEIMVFVERLEKQKISLQIIPHSAKFGGATGNFNAHHIAFPTFDWVKFADTFVQETLGLSRATFTTQIEHYDMLASQFDALKRINTICIDLARDCWTYISQDYFKQTVNKNEVGSSAMPHKVNPIDFENAEGNFGIANALYEHLSAKLPISRLQRDLTDSTVLRNIGVPMAHTIISFNSLLKGLKKLQVNEVKINNDLENNWAVVAEAIQTVLRRENFPKPYEALKNLTRGASVINQETIHTFIDSLKISAKIKTELKQITPQNYTGVYPTF